MKFFHVSVLLPPAPTNLSLPVTFGYLIFVDLYRIPGKKNTRIPKADVIIEVVGGVRADLTGGGQDSQAALLYHSRGLNTWVRA